MCCLPSEKYSLYPFGCFWHIFLVCFFGFFWGGMFGCFKVLLLKSLGKAFLLSKEGEAVEVGGQARERPATLPWRAKP